MLREHDIRSCLFVHMESSYHQHADDIIDSMDASREFIDGMSEITTPALEAYRSMVDDDRTSALLDDWRDNMMSIGLNPNDDNLRAAAIIALTGITFNNDDSRTADDMLTDASALLMAIIENKPDNTVSNDNKPPADDTFNENNDNHDDSMKIGLSSGKRHSLPRRK